MATPLHSRGGGQDMPPKGGYKPLSFGKKLTTPRVSGPALFMVTAGVVAAGFYMMGQGNVNRRALKQEKREARAAIIPYLQAEEDARYVARMEQKRKEEALIMKDVPDWQVGKSVYNNGKWMPKFDNMPQ